VSDTKKVVGFTCSTFDLFHAGHIDMLTQARNVCDYLIVGLQVDPSIDRPETKNKPVQSIVERQIQLKACSLIDEIYVYETEQDLEDLLNTLQIDVRIIGEEYRDKPFTGKSICENRGISVWYNRRDHRFSSTELRKRVAQCEPIVFEVASSGDSSSLNAWDLSDYGAGAPHLSSIYEDIIK
jgi:glycerol-3-phosphate cytidylyltransferase